MKTLYSILGIAPDASQQQIETAYAKALDSLSAETAGVGIEDQKIRLIAIKEAYKTLSDPASRQRYNQKLFAPEPTVQVYETIAEEPFWTWKKLLLISVAILLGVMYYLHNAKEREKMRIEHEREIAMKALQLREQEHNARIAAEESRLERMNQAAQEAKERQQKYEEERYRNQINAQIQQNAYAEQQRLTQENRARDSEQRRQELEAQRRLARDKAELQRLKSENDRRYSRY